MGVIGRRRCSRVQACLTQSHSKCRVSLGAIMSVTQNTLAVLNGMDILDFSFMVEHHPISDDVQNRGWRLRPRSRCH